MGERVSVVDYLVLDDGAPHLVARSWWREPLFVECVAGRIREALGDDRDRLPVVLTAHSLPRRVFETETDYVAQLHETGATVASAAGLGPTDVPDAEKHGSTITFLPLKHRQASRLEYAVADPVQQ